MKIAILAILSSLLPFVFSLWIRRLGKCGVWTVIISPIVGLFLFAILLITLVFISGDM